MASTGETMKLRLRLSLLFRMVVAAGILLSISVVVALFLTVVGGALLLGLFGWTGSSWHWRHSPGFPQ